MTIPIRLALVAAASVMLRACDTPPPVDPAANLGANTLIDNIVIAVDEPAIAAPQSQRDGKGVSQPADQERNMKPDPTAAPPPARPTTPPPARPTAPPPRRVILPAPTQPPAEIDPVLPDPGDRAPD